MSDNSGSNQGRSGGNRSSSLPYLLIGIGLLVLLYNLGWLGDIFGSVVRVLQLWPVALIAVGADLLTKGRYRAAIAAAAVVVGLVLLFVWQRPPGAAGAGEVQQVNVALAAARSIDLKLESGVNGLQLGSSAGSASALSGEVAVGRRERVSVDWRERGGTLDIEVVSRRAGGPFAFFNWTGVGGATRAWDLALSERVPVELDVDLGVGEADLDLARVDLRHLDLDAGVGSTYISLPHNTNLEATINGGVGEITVVLPAGLPARIDVDSGLGRVEVDDAFERRGGSYLSPTYREGSSAAIIDIDVGVGEVRVLTTR